MKTILTTLATLLLVINFTGCGSDDTSSEKQQVVEAMVFDTNYTLAVGDTINRVTEDASIQITQNSQEDEAVYTLLGGEAEIVRK